MNWTASLLRNQLEKERKAHTARLNLLTNTSIDASNYLTLEREKEQLVQNLNQIQTDLTTTQQSVADLQAGITLKEQALVTKDTELATVKQTKQDETFSLQKDLRDYQAYHQREIARFRKEKQEAIKDLTKQNKALQILANHRLELLEQEKTALITLAKQKIKNKKEALELVSQLETKWAKEKGELEAESAEQDQLVAQEIKNLKAKYKAKEAKLQKSIQDLEKQKTELQSASEQELEQKKQELETQIATYKLQLENAKEELANSQTKLDLQKTRLEQQENSLQTKDNQLLGYGKVIEASAKILENKDTKFAQLIESLETRSKEKDLTSQQLQDLLKQDIKWLASERKELTINLQELKTESETIEKARDKELLVESLSKTESELALEQGWWDKWSADATPLLFIDATRTGSEASFIYYSIRRVYLATMDGTMSDFFITHTQNDLQQGTKHSLRYSLALKKTIREYYKHYRGTPTLTPILTEQSGLVTTLQSQLTASKEQVAKQALEQAKLEKAKEKLAKTKESLTKKVLELEAKLATNSPKDSLLQSLKNQLQEALAAKKETKDQPNPSAILKEIQLVQLIL